MTGTSLDAAAVDRASIENGWPQVRGKRTWGRFAILGSSITTAIATWCFIIGGSVGAYLPAGTGTLAIISGSLIGILFIVLACLPVSSKYGIDAVASTKPQLGIRGSILSVFLIYAATTGWNIYLFVLLGRAVVAVFPVFGLQLPEWTVSAFGVLGVVIASIMLRTGARGVQAVSKYGSIFVLALSLVILIILLSVSGLDALFAAEPSSPSDDVAVNWASSIEVLIASNLSWWAYTGAMVRNSPSARASLWPVVIGLGLAVGVGSLTGLYGALLWPESGGDPTQYLADLGGPVFGVIALIFVAIANITTAVMGMYAGTIAFRQIPGVTKLSWWASVWIAALPAILIIAFFSELVFDQFGTFLAFLGLMFAPMCGIQIVDYFVLRRQRLSMLAIYTLDHRSSYWFTGGFNIPGLVAFAAGCATYLFLLDPGTYESRFPFQYLTATIPTVIVSAAVFWIGTALINRPAGLGGYTQQASTKEKTHV